MWLLHCLEFYIDMNFPIPYSFTSLINLLLPTFLLISTFLLLNHFILFSSSSSIHFSLILILSLFRFVFCLLFFFSFYTPFPLFSSSSTPLIFPLFLSYTRFISSPDHLHPLSSLLFLFCSLTTFTIILLSSIHHPFLLASALFYASTISSLSFSSYYTSCSSSSVHLSSYPSCYSSSSSPSPNPALPHSQQFTNIWMPDISQSNLKISAQLTPAINTLHGVKLMSMADEWTMVNASF